MKLGETRHYEIYCSGMEVQGTFFTNVKESERALAKRTRIPEIRLIVNLEPKI